MSGVIDLPSAFVKLDTLTAAGAASVEIPLEAYIAAGFKKIIVEAEGVKGSIDDVNLLIDVKSTGAYGAPDYYQSTNGANPPVWTYGAGGVVAMHSGAVAAANQLGRFTTEFAFPSAAAAAKDIVTRGCWYSGYSGIPVNRIDSTVVSIDANALTGLRYRMSGGTITGNFRIKGVK